jgi:hypothetical protein
VQLHAAKANAEGQAADGATVHAGQAGSGTDADAFTERGNDFNLLFAGLPSLAMSSDDGYACFYEKASQLGAKSFCLGWRDTFILRDRVLRTMP